MKRVYHVYCPNIDFGAYYPTLSLAREAKAAFRLLWPAREYFLRITHRRVTK